jgi:hypothetical protein
VLKDPELPSKLLKPFTGNDKIEQFLRHKTINKQTKKMFLGAKMFFSKESCNKIPVLTKDLDGFELEVSGLPVQFFYH